MNVIDANVVIALFRDDQTTHAAAMEWWQELSTMGETVTVPDIAWVAFMRIVTRQRLFPVPATLEEAWAFAEALMAQPHYVANATSPRTIEEFARLTTNSRAHGNLVTDAYIAACAAVYGGTVVTFDRDFRKFDGVKVLELAA
jgi:toxin-antitoxin system PIN domain toxin